MMPRAIFPLAALLGAAAATTGHQRTGLASAKRGLMTCEETYGQGWGRCGDETSIFCYNPSLGQSCCPTDFGYCDAGSYCAPVGGYCCVDGENLATCAKNAGFSLPPSLVSGSDSATLEAPGAGYPTKPTGVAGTASPGASSATGVTHSGTNSTSNTSASGNPVVQVSVAIRGQWTLTWTTLAMAVVGVFMASC
ncbi:hypothetical protein QBC33DRAFT_556836 [Phialemonium atrogriseum]|uniref:Granulins domain-containing protein n=1 Tax=Phialemonium atrogriseum TaxID=1093897 RepID=A0AAJ0FNZ6_9PEZI|nr:uncharacterized protein QBC33DRAFT_556836 [Phialemonium atrogriseum]KAK1769544.1 hypothetical protein QBC33DRAFT_556836 [Phialemonium atrogriseum]